jgi:hypothetical protein
VLSPASTAAIDTGQPWPPELQPRAAADPETAPESEPLRTEPATGHDDAALHITEAIADAGGAARRIGGEQANRQARGEYAARRLLGASSPSGRLAGRSPLPPTTTASRRPTPIVWRALDFPAQRWCQGAQCPGPAQYRRGCARATRSPRPSAPHSGKRQRGYCGRPAYRGARHLRQPQGPWPRT